MTTQQQRYGPGFGTSSGVLRPRQPGRWARRFPGWAALAAGLSVALVAGCRPAPTGRWTLEHDRDPMTDRVSAGARLATVGGDNVRLDIFCNHGSVALAAEFDRSIQGSDTYHTETRLQLRYDRAPVFDDGWMLARSGTTVFARDSSAMIPPLWRADSLWLVAPGLDGSSIRAHFAVRGAKAAADSIRAHCA